VPHDQIPCHHSRIGADGICEACGNRAAVKLLLTDIKASQASENLAVQLLASQIRQDADMLLIDGVDLYRALRTDAAWERIAKAACVPSPSPQRRLKVAAALMNRSIDEAVMWKGEAL
jgi:hypothetical protein